ncbi:GntR family transcriptional regulator [Bosea lupini]|nr:GntR family transcriptional regulator [Bosea lupini]
MAERNGDATGDDIVERICDTLAEAIAEGALRPGMKLPEDVVGGHFGVSRTVVRGAIAVLQRDRLVERKRNRGAFVAEPGIDEARALLEARRSLEMLMLDHAFERASAEQLEALRALTIEEDRIHAAPDDAAKEKLSGRFHVELAKLAGNPVLLEALEKVLARISLVNAMYRRDHGDQCGANHHRDIIEAVAAGDQPAARRLMSQHLDDLEHRLILDEAQGDSHSLTSVLERFSARAG